MARLLYIEASPRKSRSASIEVAEHFLDAYRSEYPSDFVDKLDLWAKPLPEFDQALLDAKYAVLSGQGFTAPQKAAWGLISQMSDRLKAADKILIATPMWNFGIPYKLKHYIDLITQPGLTFSYDPATGYSGLVTEKKALCIYAQGGDYGPGTPAEQMNMQVPYLAQALRFIGITEQQTLVVSPTLAGPAADAQARVRAKAEAEKLVAAF